ncbi:hypothetical protein N9F36_02950, partial [Akkermansiaceae bacterium]|nr:hypothetical protein [Akkermansiaceae bacterium]
MMPHNLSPSFEDLADNLPSGLLLTQSLCKPVLHIREDGKKNRAFLCASTFKRGESQFIEAESLEHTWVADGKFIKPLPADIAKHVKAVLAGADPLDLPFCEVLRMKRDTSNEDYALEVIVEDSIIAAANTRSLNYTLQEEILGLEATLYPYQEQGVAWMADTLRTLDGVILADEMGLGKTLQII